MPHIGNYPNSEQPSHGGQEPRTVELDKSTGGEDTQHREGRKDISTKITQKRSTQHREATAKDNSKGERGQARKSKGMEDEKSRKTERGRSTGGR